MNIIIDANVMLGFYREHHGKGDHELTGEVSPIIDGIGVHDDLWLDEEQRIEGEWRSVVSDDEWMDGLFFDAVSRFSVSTLPVGTHYQLVRRLVCDFGFPKGSRDRWYIATAASLRDAGRCEPVIISEDMHLHDPKKGHLSGAARQAFLVDGKGKMRMALARKHKIHVRCVARHTAEDHAQADTDRSTDHGL